MSQLYGLLAGVVVCASTWGTMTFLSQEAGWLVGIFLLLFFTVATIYINGEEIHAGQKRATKALSDMELIFSGNLRQIEHKIDSLVQRHREEGTNSPVVGKYGLANCSLNGGAQHLEGEGGRQRQEVAENPLYRHKLDTMLHLVEQILNSSHPQHDPAEPVQAVGSAGIGRRLTEPV